MSHKERGILIGVLSVILVMVLLDLATDSREGVQWWHVIIEGSVAVAAMLGLNALMRDAFQLRKKLAHEKNISSQLLAESEKWRTQSKKYLEGLSHAIDAQLSAWKLSTSEKEIAFLLLKGLSLKEIAEIRNTTEKTARAQSIAIYAKSGLAGRSELSAFFLEDLLVPQNPTQN